MTYVSRNDKIKFDSSRVSLDEPPILVEIFKYEYDSLGKFQGLTKGLIVKEEYFHNGTPYGGKISHIKYENNNIETEYQTIDDFKKDTVYQWGNLERPALYFTWELTFEVSHSYIPFLGKSMENSGYTIYAKNLGIVKYGNEMDGELMEWELVEIK